MPPKGKKKGGQSREELERIQREEEERQRLEVLMRMEKDAEERQRAENESRDAEELKERKRLKKEAQLRLLSEKDAMIMSLSTQLQDIQASTSSERVELEDELRRMQQLRDSLFNELSSARSEGDEAQRKLLSEREELVLRLQLLHRELDLARSTLMRTEQAGSESQSSNEQRLQAALRELDICSQAKSTLERETSFKIKNLEREVEKLMALNRTLQDVIEAREADDRKNVTLMQLLNNQLDENKRRDQQLLDEERQRTKQAKQSLILADAKVTTLEEQLSQTKTEHADIVKTLEKELSHHREKVDQLNFDLKFLGAELHTYKSQLDRHQNDAANARTEAATEMQSTKLTLEAQKKKCEDLESLLRRKDRENFDKVTFLNAQIANNRTIIAQLQQKLNKEREDKVSTLSTLHGELEQKVSTIQVVHDDLERRKVASGEVEMKLNNDIAILKTTVFQLQSAVIDRERELDATRSTKDEEIRRLRRKLDEHFIPHRNDIETSAEPGGKSLETVLTEKNERLQREIEISNRLSLESESRLKAQIANQSHIIDALQSEILKLKEDRAMESQESRHEVTRLCQLLDLHGITYRRPL